MGDHGEPSVVCKLLRTLEKQQRKSKMSAQQPCCNGTYQSSSLSSRGCLRPLNTTVIQTDIKLL
jgi:hypothetical protein